MTPFVFANPIIAPKRYVPELVTAQEVLVTVTALGQSRAIDEESLTQVVSARMNQVGFTTSTDVSDSHDVAVQVTCKEPNASQELAPSPAGSAEELSAHRPIGPPCSVEYFFEGQLMPWQRVDLVVFSLGVESTKAVASEKARFSTQELFIRYLQHYDYPLLLTAEWGQTGRLLRLLEDPETPTERKRMIISLLGEIRAEEAFPCLVDALGDDALVKSAALVLGNFGGDARTPLVQLLRASRRADVQAAAARSLGHVGATTGQWSLTPLFIEMLERPNLDIAVQIQLVLALGKNPDRGSLPTLERMYQRVWSVRSDDPQLRELRLAIDWSHRSVRLGGHTDEY